MNKLPLEKRTQILSMLCEGSSMRSISRVCDVSINTVSKLLIDAGKACAAFHDANVRDVKSRRIQVDEIWSFTYAKQKNVPTAKRQDLAYGDTWTWTAIDADSKLIVSWLVGGRDSDYAMGFMDDLKSRLANRVQLTSDGHRAYLEAVEGALGGDIDYAMLVKIYGNTPEAAKGRYSPAECIGAEKRRVEGNPDPKHISTSYAERQNLTMRMQMRRFTRLTNAFSKKFENHMHMVALYTVWYNFVKQHKSNNGLSPAMAAGVSKTLWSMTDLADMIDATLPKIGKRGPYKTAEISNRDTTRLSGQVPAKRSYFGRIVGSPPGLPGGGITGMLPASGVAARISGSTPAGGHNTPSDFASLSPSGSALWPVVVPPGGDVRIGAQSLWRAGAGDGAV